MPAANRYPFVERDGRIYAASKSSVPTVWPFAVDEVSREGWDKLHDAVKIVVGSNFYGPVEDVLAEDPQRIKSVVDLGCGSGKWVIEMAEQFPHVHFTGVDVAPPPDEGVPSNVKFDYCNVIEGTNFADSTFDVVHIRTMLLAVPDFPSLIAEAARILRPGGLFLAAEFSWFMSMDLPNPISMPLHVPMLTRFVANVGDFASGLRISTMAEAVTMTVRMSGLYEDDGSIVHTLPLGGNQIEEGLEEIGKALADNTMDVARSARWMFREGGWTNERYDELLAGVEEELNTKPGIFVSYYMTHARKI